MSGIEELLKTEGYFEIIDMDRNDIDDEPIDP